MKYDKRVAGIDIIDLGMGNPTDPTPESVVNKLAEASLDPRNHRYSVSNGIAGLAQGSRQKIPARNTASSSTPKPKSSPPSAPRKASAISAWRCSAPAIPSSSAIPLSPSTFMPPPWPAPTSIRVPLGNDQAFLDRIEKMIEGLYPHAQAADPQLSAQSHGHDHRAGFWERAIAMCRRHGIMIISDFAYGEICFDGYKAPSFLAADGSQRNRRRIHHHVQELQHGRLARRLLLPATPRWSRRWPPSRATTTTASSPRSRSPASSRCANAQRRPTEQSKIYEHRRDVVCRGWTGSAGPTKSPAPACSSGRKIKPEHLKGEGTIDFCLRMMDEAEVALAPAAPSAKTAKDTSASRWSKTSNAFARRCGISIGAEPPPAQASPPTCGSGVVDGAADFLFSRRACSARRVG